MEWFTNVLENPYSIGVIILCNLVLFILYFMNLNKLHKLRKVYSSFMNRLGNGKNLEEMMRHYMNRVDEVEKQNKELQQHCQEIEKNAKTSLQKVGIVRYNAFNDTGSDLSFAIALLDDNDTGVVLNGIYTFEGTNVYAKPIKNGTSTYVLSDEEKSAIEKAIQGM